jgi:hypothetical protein
MLRGTRHSLLVLFPLLAALSVVQSFNPVAFRAVSPLLHERQMAQVLAGERAMEAVAKEAYSIRTVDGSEAARRFLENVPKAYLRENELIQHIVSDIQVQQLVIVNSKMDTRAYELNCLADIDVIEVEDKTLLPIKESLIQTRGSHIPLLAKSVRRVTDMDQSLWWPTAYTGTHSAEAQQWCSPAPRRSLLT